MRVKDNCFIDQGKKYIHNIQPNYRYKLTKLTLQKKDLIHGWLPKQIKKIRCTYYWNISRPDHGGFDRDWDWFSSEPFFLLYDSNKDIGKNEK